LSERHGQVPFPTARHGSDLCHAGLVFSLAHGRADNGEIPDARPSRGNRHCPGAWTGRTWGGRNEEKKTRSRLPTTETGADKFPWKNLRIAHEISREV